MWFCSFISLFQIFTRCESRGLIIARLDDPAMPVRSAAILAAGRVCDLQDKVHFSLKNCKELQSVQSKPLNVVMTGGCAKIGIFPGRFWSELTGTALLIFLCHWVLQMSSRSLPVYIKGIFCQSFALFRLCSFAIRSFGKHEDSCQQIVRWLHSKLWASCFSEAQGSHSQYYRSCFGTHHYRPGFTRIGFLWINLKYLRELRSHCSAVTFEQVRESANASLDRLPPQMQWLRHFWMQILRMVGRNSASSLVKSRIVGTLTSMSLPEVSCRENWNPGKPPNRMRATLLWERLVFEQFMTVYSLIQSAQPKNL